MNSILFRRMKKYCKKAWQFIWEDDSWGSWAVNILLAFVIIKFIIYPLLAVILHTSYPIVAVVSSSMEHDGNFDDWWSSNAICQANTPCIQEQYYNQINISKKQFRSFGFRNGFNKGDIMILYRSKPSEINLGDVIVFNAGRQDPIIHRVISVANNGNNYVYQTKGDHNQGSFYFESGISENNYIGKSVLRIPFLGYIKIGFVKLLSLVGF